jgi:putative hydrolase of the HAD superfamily
MKYKHYSFDLWLTLIKSNPEFKRKRAEFFCEKFNPTNKTVEEIEQIIREIDVIGTMTNEVVGKNIDPYELLSFILLKLNYNHFNYQLLEVIYKKLEKIFLQYHPVLMTPETKNILSELWKDKATLSILSNTGFITGKTLYQVLSNLEINHYSSFAIFSDQIGISKPNRMIFNLLVDRVRKLRQGEYIQSEHILHVGDNETADVWGARQVGIESLLIKDGNLKPLIQDEQSILVN